MGIARLSRFLRDRRAVGAVEFAVVAPVLLLLYVGGSELAVAVTLNRKVQHAGATVNDLVTQSDLLTKGDVDRIFKISAAILTPYSAAPLRLRVTSVKVSSPGKAKIECSRVYDKTTTPLQPLIPGKDYQLPAEFATLPTGSTMMVTESRYDYVPLGGFGLKTILAGVTGNASGLIQMGSMSYLNPRIGNSVACSDWNT